MDDQAKATLRGFQERLSTGDVAAAYQWLMAQSPSSELVLAASQMTQGLQPPAHIAGQGHAIAPNGVAIGTLVQQLVGPQHPESLRKADLEDYLNSILKGDTLQISVALDKEYRAQDKPEIRPPRFSAVYIEQRAALRASRSQDKEPSGEEMIAREGKGDEAPKAVMDWIAQHRHLVITAGPGMGKSSLFRQLAVQMAGLKHDVGAGERLRGLPLVINLRRLSRWLQEHERFHDEQWREEIGPSLFWDYLAHEWATKAWKGLAEGLRHWLAEEPNVVAKLLAFLIDGLDEVPVQEGTRTLVARLLEELAASHPELRILLTSRTRSYRNVNFTWRLRHRGSDKPEEWPTIELLPFDEDEIKRFTRAWFRELVVAERLSDEEAEHFIDTFIATLGDANRADLARLAKVPLNATAMVLIHWLERELPPGRAALFHRLFHLLLGAWEETRERDAGVKAAESPFRRLLREPAQWHRGVDIDTVSLMRDLGHLLFRLTWEFAQDTEARRERRDLDSAGIDIPKARLRRLFAGLANGQLLVDDGNLEDDGLPSEAIEWAEKLLGFIQEHGGLLDPAAGDFAFPHRQYGEFLAGWWLVEHAGEGASLARLLSPKEGDQQLCQSLEDWEDVWREPVLLAVSHLLCERKEAAIEHLVRAVVPSPADAPDHALIIAAEILREHGSEAHYACTDDLWGQVRQALKHRLTDKTRRPTQRDRLGSALALIGDDRHGIGLRGDGLPDFHWIEIPAPSGKRFTMHDVDGGSFEAQIDSPFWISAYPVTVAQFEAFVRAGGYDDVAGEAWWSKEGWAWRKEQAIDGPEYVSYGAAWQRANVPVTGVSYAEAEAYCRWLRSFTEDERLSEARLPAEWEWAFVAEGEEGRLFPWGPQDKDLSERCNFQHDIGHVTPVGLYQQEKVDDLAGNVWEWTETRWQNELGSYKQDRAHDVQMLEGLALRGGSWDFYDHGLVRAAARFHFRAELRNLSLGFRVVSSPILSKG